MDKGSYGRRDRLIKEKRHDVYQERNKWPEPTLCTECGALFVGGRWSWQAASSAQTNKTICPACRRIADNYPAGYVEIKGSFFDEHRDEIISLILNIEKREKDERPLERIISIVGAKDYATVTTTGIHIARRIGEALSRAYKGGLSFQYATAAQSIRVYWER
jgi:NMD protein affecting ribosome stability and mRNA decay